MLQTSHENFLRKTVFQYTGRRLNPISITNMFTGPAELLWKWWGWLVTQSRGAENTFSPPPLVFFRLKLLPLDQLPIAFAQLLLDNEDIFRH